MCFLCGFLWFFLFFFLLRRKLILENLVLLVRSVVKQFPNMASNF